MNYCTELPGCQENVSATKIVLSGRHIANTWILYCSYNE